MAAAGTVVARGGVASKRNAVQREVLGQRPGVLAGARRDQGRRLRRPSDHRGVPNLQAQFGREIAIGFGVRGSDPAARTARIGFEPAGARGVERFRCNSSYRRLRTTLQSPRFSVTLQSNFKCAAAQSGHLARGGAKKLRGVIPRFTRQNEQKLAAAAGAEQEA